MRAVEVRLAEQRACEQQRRIDRRELAVLEALPRLHVEEMIEKALVSRHSILMRALGRVVQEAERRQHALARVLARHVAALDADRIRGEAEAYGRDARERRRRIAVRDESVPGIGRVPEKAESPLLEVDQDRFDQRTQGTRRRRTRAAVPERHRPAVMRQQRHHDEERHKYDHYGPTLSIHCHFHAPRLFAAPNQTLHHVAVRRGTPRRCPAHPMTANRPCDILKAGHAPERCNAFPEHCEKGRATASSHPRTCATRRFPSNSRRCTPAAGSGCT